MNQTGHRFGKDNGGMRLVDDPPVIEVSLGRASRRLLRVSLLWFGALAGYSIYSLAINWQLCFATLAVLMVVIIHMIFDVAMQVVTAVSAAMTKGIRFIEENGDDWWRGEDDDAE